MNTKTDKYPESVFENIKHLNENNIEFWYARELQGVLDYAQWRNLESVIDKAKTACLNSGNNVSDHFADVSKMVDIGSGTKRQIAGLSIQTVQIKRMSINMKAGITNERSDICAVFKPQPTRREHRRAGSGV